MPKQLTTALLLISLSAMTAQAAAGIGSYDAQLPTIPQSQQADFPAAWRLAQVAPAASPQLAAAIPARAYSLADGMLAGQMAAANIGTRRNFLIGLAGGSLLGLIGTGVCYFATGSADLGDKEYRSMMTKGTDYRLGFEKGYKGKSKSRKRRAALGGGLIGTLIGVVLLLGAQ